LVYSLDGFNHDDGLLTRLKRAAQWSFGLPAAVAVAVASVAAAAAASVAGVASVAAAAAAAAAGGVAATTCAAAAAAASCVSRVAALYIAPYTQRLGAGDSDVRNPESQRPEYHRVRKSERAFSEFRIPKRIPKTKTDCSRRRRRRCAVLGDVGVAGEMPMLSPCLSFRL